MELLQFDVKNAFLNASRSHDSTPVTCELPDGFKKAGICVELLKALYGLRDSPQLWYEELASKLRELGLEACPEEPCLFYTKDRDVFLVFYVDDILIAFARRSEQATQHLIAGLKQAYELHDEGEVRFFLGIQVIRDREQRRIYLCHEAYIDRIASKYSIEQMGTFPTTPIVAHEIPKRKDPATKQEIKLFQELIGSILYTSIMIRPDVAYAAAYLSQHLTNPSIDHIKAARQVMRHLFLTRKHALTFGASNSAQALRIASDASFADDTFTRRSSQGYIVYLFGGPVIWKAKRQTTVTTSTTEAELLAVSETARETIALQRLFGHMKLQLDERPTIECDNRQTIRLVLAKHERLNTRLRHVDIHNMWLKQEYAKGKFELVYTESKAMPADGLTKALAREPFESFIQVLGFTDIRTIAEERKLTSRE